MKRHNYNASIVPLVGKTSATPTKRGLFNKESFFTTPHRHSVPLPPQGGQLTANGFTLIELLVVVLIIGILSAVALPQYQKAVYKARLANLKNIANSISQAQNLYRMANGDWAHDFAELDIEMPSGRLSYNQKTYYYAWGYCGIDMSGTGSWGGCYCYDSKSALGYAVWHASGKRYCLVGGTTDKQNSIEAKVCQADTGSSTWTSSFGYLYK